MVEQRAEIRVPQEQKLTTGFQEYNMSDNSEKHTYPNPGAEREIKSRVQVEEC